MATTPINELVETIKLVRTMKESLDSLVDVVERLSERLINLERIVGDAAGTAGE